MTKLLDIETILADIDSLHLYPFQRDMDGGTSRMCWPLDPEQGEPDGYAVMGQSRYYESVTGTTFDIHDFGEFEQPAIAEFIYEHLVTVCPNVTDYVKDM